MRLETPYSETAARSVDVDDKGEVKLDFPPSDNGDAPRREPAEPVLSE